MGLRLWHGWRAMKRGRPPVAPTGGALFGDASLWFAVARAHQAALRKRWRAFLRFAGARPVSWHCAGAVGILRFAGTRFHLSYLQKL